MAESLMPEVGEVGAASREQQAPKTWPTKDILFQGQERKIVLQNENGPCSLLAIANILLLRGDVRLEPPDRPLVDYDYLSSLIAEHLLTRPPPAGVASGSSANAQGEDDGALEKALSLLPQTQHGLNLNPSFLANNSFHTSDGERQMELFRLLGIDLYHGFLPDPAAPLTYEQLREAGSYDAAVDEVVQGDALATRFLREALNESTGSQGLRELLQRGGEAVVTSTQWGTAQERKILFKAFNIAAFLDSNGSQLTYPGLFALSSLPEGTLAALFRFNHLSVLYRPTRHDSRQDAIPASEDNSVPSMLTLITDEAFLDEELAVWETLADVDGMDSGEIFDGRLCRRRIDQTSRQAVWNVDGEDGRAVPHQSEDADFALALQLHADDRARAEERRRRRERHRGVASDRLQGRPGSSLDPTSAAFHQEGSGGQRRPGGSQGIMAALGFGRHRTTNTARQGLPSPAVDASSQTTADGFRPAMASSRSGEVADGNPQDALEAARQGAASDLGAVAGSSGRNSTQGGSSGVRRKSQIKSKDKKDCLIM